MRLAIVVTLSICCFLTLLSNQALAVKAAPQPVLVRQPDGSEVTIYLKGDEYLHWNEDEAGFAVVKSEDGLWWVYARQELGRLVPTSYRVGRVDPLSVGLSKPNIARLREAARQSPILQKSTSVQDSTGPQNAPPTGTMLNLVVLVNFSDLAISYSTPAYDDLFNQTGYTTDGASGSVKDYYTEVSYGALTVQSTVPEPVTLSSGYAYYGANDIYGNDIRPRQMVQQALAALEARGFNFATMDGDGDGWVDGLTIIHAGGGEEYSGNDPSYIWSHKWQMPSTVTYDGVKMLQYHTEPARRGWDGYPTSWGITRIGVICHENGHFIGLPDLYDYGYDSEGAGNFCLMAGGSWNGSSGTTPAHPSAYCKAALGWVTPTVITGNGYFPLSRAETAAQSYKLQGAFPSTQYFLVENRQGVGFDSGLPGTERGMLIWHVDRTVPNNDDQTHYMVDLEEASGTQHLALNQNRGEDSDYFRSGNATAFDASTTPNNLGYSGQALGLDVAEASMTGATMFFVVNPMMVTIQSPAGGERLAVGSSYAINWTVNGDPDSIGIFLSLDSGATFGDTVATGLVGVTTYDWTVPYYPVATARLKVAAYKNGVVYGTDVMDGDFTIQGDPYRFVSPTGGNVYPYSTPAWAARHIADAIDAASFGDSIMVAAGTYRSAIIVEKPVYLLGGWNAGFTARDTQANVTTIVSSGSAVTFINITSGSPGIEGFTITGGSGTQVYMPDLGGYGGGVFVYDSPALIKNNVIAGCGYTSAMGFSGGGGIACWNGSVTIAGNAISSCVAQCGGGIYLFQATAAITGNTISGARPNEAYTGAKNGGGVFARQTNVTMAANVISANTGYRTGGGIYATLSPVSTSGDSIYANEVTSSGGGIYSLRSPLSIHNTYIANNVAVSRGGAIYHRAGLFDMANSVVAANTAMTSAGGVYADSCWGSWTNNTIDRNTSVDEGGNVYVKAAAAPMDIRNNIVSYGSPNGFEALHAGNITFQYNNCYGNAPADVVTILPDTTNSSRNPSYTDTLTMDYYLGVHSGSIDAGDPSVGDPDGSIVDQGAFGGPGAVFAAPAYVDNLAASAANDTTMKLTWDGRSPAGLDYYAVYADTAAGFAPDVSNFIGAAAASVDSFLHHPVAGCRYYRVSLVDASGHASGYSNVSGACAAGPDLIPPTVAVVQPAGGESFAPADAIDIRWVAADNRQVDSVSIYYSQNAGREYLLIAHGEPNDSLYQWIVPGISSDSCVVRVVAFDHAKLAGEDASDGYFSVRASTGTDGPPAIAFSLAQNYPNPFNPLTTIDYSVARTSPVELAIFDVNGRKIRTLVGEIKARGIYKTVWNGRNDRGSSVASGVYFYRLTAGDFIEIKKMILLR